MIIRPEFNNNDISIINTLDQFRDIHRDIVIYKDSKNSNFITIINSSIQIGSIGLIQNPTEILYTINYYYGEVKEPLFLLPNLKYNVNMDALIIINEYNYVYKIIDKFKNTCKAVDSYDGILNGEYVLYKNEKDKIILPTDPRFYNLDHQLKVTDDDSAYATRDKLDSDLARSGYGVTYTLRELIDENTSISVTSIEIDDPFNIMNFDNNLKDFINYSISLLIHSSLRAGIIEFKCIFDYLYGYNVRDCVKGYDIEKEYNKEYMIEFADCIKNIYESIKDIYNLKIRYTFVQKKYNTYIQILPADFNEVNYNLINRDINRIIESNLY